MKHLSPILLGSLLILLALAPVIGAVSGLSGLWAPAAAVLGIGLVLLSVNLDAQRKPSPVRVRAQDRRKSPHQGRGY